MTEDDLRQAGWKPVQGAAFVRHVGPFWTRGTPPERELGFLGRDDHGNHINVVNGGMLATFADVALGYAVVDVLGGAGCATAQLSLQYIGAAPMGELITCKPEVIRRTSSLVFVRGLICVGEKVVSSADGIWKILEKKL